MATAWEGVPDNPQQTRSTILEILQNAWVMTKIFLKYAYVGDIWYIYQFPQISDVNFLDWTFLFVFP